MNKKSAIKDALDLLFTGIKELKEMFPEKEFTIDGRLVGDIGEILASLDYEVELFPIQKADHDGVTPDDRKVQIKASFKDSLTFKTIPDYYLGLKLYRDGNYEEIYNGPGINIYNRYSHRKGVGVKLLSFPIRELKRLSKEVSELERIPKRTK